ncbi:MAG: glycosyltransferase [Bacteroides sp.]|nr:glycosyltransferase [Ruminococcus flavefaciens]MCM1555549.1 glycosyltransferase [Bacteroides sp.]
MKVLIVCDAFPPEFAPRMGYLCKYLPRMGCTADVVCEQCSDDRRFAFLENTAGDVKRIRFYSSLSMPRPRGEWLRLMFRDLFFHYKDKRLFKEIQKDKAWDGYDLVLCSTYRTFPLRAAAKLANHFHVPLVADLRDIVEQYPDRSYLTHRLPFAALLTRHLLKERNRVLKKAAAVVSVSEWHRDFLKRFNPNTHLIYNGYDPELFFPAPQPDPCFRIVFTGRMISVGNRNPEWLFAAVSNLIKSGRLGRHDFRICWHTDGDTMQFIKKEAEKYGIGDVTECSGYVPAEQVSALLNQASLLLQLANVSDAKGPKGVMTTKFFEALAVGKPLLLIPGDRSYLEELIRRYDCGLAATDVESVETFIENQYNKWKQTGSTQIGVHPEIARLFSREQQAGQFLQLFNTILNHE